MGQEESFDLSKEWRLDPRRDKPDRFVLNRINKSPTGTFTLLGLKYLLAVLVLTHLLALLVLQYFLALLVPKYLLCLLY